jgi:hypothetical protein
MRFKQYLSELANIEVGQAIEAHEPTEENSSDVITPRVFAEVNHRLVVELNAMILSPEDGLQKIRKTLHRYGMDLPALYDPDPLGDELIISLYQYGNSHGVDTSAIFNTGSDVQNRNPDAYLYIIYYMTDEGRYDFFAEMVREMDLEDIINQDEYEDEDLNFDEE